MTDNTAKQAHDNADETAAKATGIAKDAAERVHDGAGDTATKVAGVAEEITGQVRHAVDETVSTGTSAVSDFDLDKAAESVVAVAREAVDKVATAYKRNPALVLTLGSIAVAALTAIGALATRRR